MGHADLMLDLLLTGIPLGVEVVDQGRHARRGGLGERDRSGLKLVADRYIKFFEILDNFINTRLGGRDNDRVEPGHGNKDHAGQLVGCFRANRAIGRLLAASLVASPLVAAAEVEGKAAALLAATLLLGLAGSVLPGLCPAVARGAHHHGLVKVRQRG